MNTEKNQEVFNMLSELEEYFYYKLQNPEELSRFWGTLAEMYEDTKTMLLQWHKMTGCVNQ